MKVGAGALLAATLTVAGIAAVLLASPASASITGPCTASINGQNISALSSTSAGDAVKVKQHSQATVAMGASKPISHLKVAISFAGFSWTVHDESSSGNSWTRDVDVDSYSKYGVGLYRVSGTSTGANVNCTGAALVKVEGGALSSYAGKAGLAAAAIGLLGVFGAGFLPLGRLTLGPVAGLIGGAGVGILLQESSVLFPTRTVAIVEFAGGAVAGVALPWVLKLIR